MFFIDDICNGKMKNKTSNRTLCVKFSHSHKIRLCPFKLKMDRMKTGQREIKKISTRNCNYHKTFKCDSSQLDKINFKAKQKKNKKTMSKEKF